VHLFLLRNFVWTAWSAEIAGLLVGCLDSLVIGYIQSASWPVHYSEKTVFGAHGLWLDLLFGLSRHMVATAGSLVVAVFPGRFYWTTRAAAWTVQTSLSTLSRLFIGRTGSKWSIPNLVRKNKNMSWPSSPSRHVLSFLRIGVGQSRHLSYILSGQSSQMPKN